MQIKNVLLLGCGYIGGQADLTHPITITYAKALSSRKDVRVTLFDPNIEQAEKIKKVYGFRIVENKSELEYSKFDLIIIASPSICHFSDLATLLKSNVPSIICEKPLCTNSNDLISLKKLLKKSNSHVLVSYNRNFDPIFLEARHKISQTFPNQEPIKISINYQRGFLNNCSHALSLCELLLDKKFEISRFDISEKEFDNFPNDPTISGFGLWGNTSLLINGISNAEFSHLELQINYKAGFVRIFDSAQKICIQTAPKSDHGVYMKPDYIIFEGCSESNPVENIIDKALKKEDFSATSSDVYSIINLTDAMFEIIER